MTETHLPEQNIDSHNAPDKPDMHPDAPAAEGMPEYLPAKFWNADTGEVQLEDLARSYNQLEKRLGMADGDTVPDNPEGYRIEPSMEGLTTDPDVNTRLMEAGFTQAQAQLVYDLAAEKLAPLVRDLATETVQEDHRRRLSDHFGGAQRWETTASQLESWGKANLPDAVFDALSQSYDGVLTLHRMMQDGEPELISGAIPSQSGRSEAQLRRMMEDPRYWRDHDPAYAKEITKGFEDLYPDEG